MTGHKYFLLAILDARLEAAPPLACLIKAEIVPRFLGDMINDFDSPPTLNVKRVLGSGESHGVKRGTIGSSVAYKEGTATVRIVCLLPPPAVAYAILQRSSALSFYCTENPSCPP